MPRPAIDLPRYIQRIPSHVMLLPDEAQHPHLHYRRSSNDSWNLLLYAERNWAGNGIYAAASERHFHRLTTMVLLSIVEAFERFLKEVASECINHASVLIPDDRLDVFTVKGNLVAAHYGAASVGRALCESLPWCDCEDTNKRYRRILSNPFDAGNFYVFPQLNQSPDALRNRIETMSLIWQLRHTIAHNMGVITSSDKIKFQLLVRGAVEAPRLLWPTKGDVWYVKLFLDETAELINANVATRLGDLLTLIIADNPTHFQPDVKAQELANIFQIPFTISNQTMNPA